MNETSSQFFELTQRKGWIKSVDIVVPKNWSPKSCYNPGKEWIYKRIPTRDKTDIVIGNGNFSIFIMFLCLFDFKNYLFSIIHYF